MKSLTVSDTIDRIITTTTKEEEDAVAFIPSNTFQGSKVGYYFGTSQPHGTGYHRDTTTIDTTTTTNSSKKRTISNQNNGGGEEKRVKFQPQEDNDDTVIGKQTKNKTGEELLEEAERELQEAPFIPKILSLKKSASSKQQFLQQLSHQLQKLIQQNLQLRMKYTPDKFMESELTLHDTISSYHAMATDTTLYPYLVSSQMTAQFHTLLSHDNVDIALAIISLLLELLDPSLINDDSGESRHHLMALIQHTMDVNGLDLIISNLGRLHTEEGEEMQGIENILTLMEYVMEITMDDTTASSTTTSSRNIATMLVQETNFISWIFQQLSSFPTNKNNNMAYYLHLTEVLALLLQQLQPDDTYPDISQLPLFTSAFVEEEQQINEKKEEKGKVVDGMEILLQCIAIYRKKDPSQEEECEALENIFTILSSTLLSSTNNISAFLERQGMELMLRCIREKVHSGAGSLKVISYCLSTTLQQQNSNDVIQQACNVFVQVGGLKHLFPIFMKRTIPKPASCSDAFSGKTTKKAKRARKEWMQQLQVHSIQILYALTLYLDETNDGKERLITKFLEQDKCMQLVTCLLKYDEKMRCSEYKFYKSDQAETLEEKDEELLDLAALHAKLKGGGDLFHRLGAIIGYVCMYSKRCHTMILQDLKTKESGIGVVKAALTGFMSVLDDDLKTKEHLQKYLDAIV